MTEHIIREQEICKKVSKRMLMEFDLRNNPLLWFKLIRNIDGAKSSLPESSRWSIISKVLNEFHDISFCYFSRKYIEEILEDAEKHKRLEKKSVCLRNALEFLTFEGRLKLRQMSVPE